MEETGGQAAESAGTETTTGGTTEATPEGQSTTPDQKTANGTDAGAESFFDYETIKGKPELESAYKEMQRAFTKKTGEVAKSRDKLKQYDEFIANPVDSMKKLAQQYGYNLVQGQQDAKNPQKFETWDDVMAEAKKQVMDELEPMLGEVKNLKKQSIESYLDTNFTDWRTYEDDMIANLQEHPSLANDPQKLYRLSVPESVYEARMLKKAEAKLRGTSDASTVRGQSSTTKETSQKPSGPLSFDQAVEVAKQTLARQGKRPPNH